MTLLDNNEDLRRTSMSRGSTVALLLVLVIGISVRLWHIDWDLPEVYEEATPFGIAWQFWNHGQPGFDFNPGFFNYPALTFHVQFLGQVFHYLAGRVVGIYPDIHAFHQAYLADRTTFLVVARLLTMMWDIGTMFVVFFTGRRVFGIGAGILAASIIALNPLYIEQSHMVVVDPALAFFAASALLFMLSLSSEPRTRWYVLSGLMIGLATASKYTGAVLLLVLLLVHLFLGGNFRSGLRSLLSRKLAMGFLIAGGVFLIVNPFIVVNTEKFLEGFGYEMWHMERGHFGIEGGQSTPVYYLFEVFPRTLGWPLYLISLGTLVWAVTRRNKKLLLVVAYTLVFFLPVASWTMRAERYIMPIIPGLALLTSYGTMQLLAMVTRHIGTVKEWSSGWFTVLKRVGVGALFFILLASPASLSARYLRMLSMPDTRTAAKHWIRQSLRPGGTIAMAPLGIRLDPQWSRFPIPYAAVNFEKLSPFYDARWYVDCDAVIGSSFDHARFLLDTTKYRDFLKEFYERLLSDWVLLYHATPEPLQRGPEVLIFVPPPDADTQDKFPSDLTGKLLSFHHKDLTENFINNLIMLQTIREKPGRERQLKALLVEWYLNYGYNDDARRLIDQQLERDPSDPDFLGLQARVTTTSIGM